MRFGSVTTTGPRLPGGLAEPPLACATVCACAWEGTARGQAVSRHKGVIDVRNQLLIAPESKTHAGVRDGAIRPFLSMTDMKFKDSNGERSTVRAVAAVVCLSPQTADTFSYSRLRGTPPDAFARDHDRQQVSWLAGYRLGPPSQKHISFQWHSWSSAIRLQLRGQPRNCS